MKRGGGGRRRKYDQKMQRLNFECWPCAINILPFLVQSHQQNQKVSMSLKIAPPHIPTPNFHWPMKVKL